MWGIILDVAALAVIVFFVILSAKKGFAKTILGLAAIVAALVLSLAFGGKASDWVYDSFIKDRLVKSVTAAVNDTVNDTVDAFTKSLPEVLVKGAKAFGVYDKISESKLETAEGTVSALESNVIRPIATSVLRVLATIIIFVVLLFLLNLLVKAIDNLFKLPIVGGVNRTLGGVVGFIKGVAVLFLALALIAAISTAIKGDFLIFSEENIAKSQIFKYIYYNNPLIEIKSGL